MKFLEDCSFSGAARFTNIISDPGEQCLHSSLRYLLLELKRMLYFYINVLAYYSFILFVFFMFGFLV